MVERILLVLAGLAGLAYWSFALRNTMTPASRSKGRKRGTGLIDWMIDTFAYADMAGGSLPLGFFIVGCLAALAVGLIGYE